ncbi:MAG: flagellar motor switch protein FliN [Candidatus Cloacimonetes bacterium]|jgi:flagellar motor switch protein FliN/FliY|nr:flagellar motor switch protein FliN [Candidatus Cloacimonadota bacterium]MDD4155593.1 flagellar motor switch protein FliN [Candidatus Cloacimonadota bacterium]
MTGIKSLDKFLEFLNSNAGGVLSTITNQQIYFSTKEFTDFDFSVIEEKAQLPCLIITVSFTGAQDFQFHLITSKATVASLSDLMMLGTGDVEYIPEEHNDAIQEMLNQVMGSITSELDAEGIEASGVVTEVELTDLEIQKDFMTDSKTVELNFELLGNEASFFMIIDQTSLDTIDNLFDSVDDNETSQDNVNVTNKESASSNKKQKPQQDPVKVSRASFAEIEEVRPSSAKNVNIDILLDISLPVTVELGHIEMRIKDVLDLGQGSVVELDKLAGDLVDLMINGKKFAVGEVMVVDDNYAVRIVNLISRDERIRTLGPQ